MPNIDQLLAATGTRDLVVIAHRGFSGRAPENTLAAFEQAADLGVDMIELDVTLTRDGEVIVLHDQELDRTTSGRGPAMLQTLAQLEQLDCGSWFSPEFANERIPTLDAVFELLAERDVTINVEIKGEGVLSPPSGFDSTTLPTAVAHLIERHRFEDRVVVSSFEPLALHELRRRAPAIRRASLFNKELHRGLSPLQVIEPVAARAFSVSWRQLTAARVRQCHQHQLPIFVYTLDRESQMTRAIDMGVNGIFTNRPDRLLALLERSRPEND